jgi:ATP-dependent DNA helicase RecG
MRPEPLFPLFKSVTSLPGIGPRFAKLLIKLAGPNLVDLFWHLPIAIIDRRYSPKVVEAQHGVVVTVKLRVLKHVKPSNKRLPYKVFCSDDTGTITLVFFHSHSTYLHKTLPVGEVRVVSGKVEKFGNELQITHPDHIVTIDEISKIKLVEPVYSLTAGLTIKVLSKAVRGSLNILPDLPEWIDPSYLSQNGWKEWRVSLLEVHSPDDEKMLAPNSTSRLRLAYDELLANQLALALVRASMRHLKGHSIDGDGSLRTKVIEVLPFKLTNSQEDALQEIIADMAQPIRMLRLLQGDVGSGKTLVALMAMLYAVEAGGQAVIMAPTEILARQHLATIEPLAIAVGVKISLLKGGEKKKIRDDILEKLRIGEIDLVIGTHALIQDDVQFKSLVLAVIDEQHRFGVDQRLALTAKGDAVDLLGMTATPIPRTLMLTTYGDMDVSRLRDKPSGRLPIDTRVMPIERLKDVIIALRRSIDNNAQVYWVCPLVEESDVLEISAVEDRYKQLKNIFHEQVDIIHGRLNIEEKKTAMKAFSAGITKILVATTVIEVGVDVPEATVMVVEHAERFGLAQLHQLRGRIGRGAGQSTCLLLYASPLTSMAEARLKIMRETDDGFRIAEEDLKLRGAGEMLGTRQSGFPEFRLADLTVHADLLLSARNDAELVLSQDSDLTSERGKALRILLYLFEREEAVRNLRSG